jgi:glutathione S-transferase
MLELYHNAASTCSQKVRLVLEEKELSWKSHDVDLISGGQHDAEYVKLNQNRVVPTLVHDGRPLIESTLINDYLDDAFPEVPMRSSDPALRHVAGLWIKQIDTKVHPAAGVVTYAIGPRRILLEQPKDVLERNLAAIPDPAARARRRSVIDNGVEAPEFAGALGAFLDLIDDLDAALSPGVWLSGERFGLADACVLPYVLRLDHLAMSPLLTRDARPNLHDWYARVRALPSYEKAVTQVLPAPVIELFRTSGAAVWAEVEPLTRRASR